MSTYTLRPWTDIVKLHPDVEEGTLPEAVFAIDLGAIAANDPNVPAVNRDARAFFKATYLTRDLKRLLEEVMASLSGQMGYNRVLKLRTPFGGGKSHTLSALLHAARCRDALELIPEAKGLANPGKVKVAVFDGEKFDARTGKILENGQVIRTMWGWIAWQLGEGKFKLVEDHDKNLTSPGGDVVREMLAGGPKLLLLDEVLKYMERAGAVAIHDSTLRRQALDFFHNLTVEVANSKEAVLVYSLQWSAREAMDNVALLQELDKMAGRVDQLREPVTGDEILPILQRRLLGKLPPAEVAQQVADAYSEIITGMRRAYAESARERQQAEEEGLALRNRIRAAYPFHPALIDCMKERWSSIDDFQRTRGALRFLASCLHSLKKESRAKPLLGPAEIPLYDVEVRVKMLKDLGAQNEYDPVILADIEGPNARAKRIDDRFAREVPAMANVKPAARIATAMFAYSFGGLRREGPNGSETLPPGVTENELLATCVGPELDNITAGAVLAELRNTCLYLHYDGVRYCFKKDPNVTKLVEDAEQEVARDSEGIKTRIREMLMQKLAGHSSAFVWPEKSHDLPDEEPLFLIGYIPLEFAKKTKSEQEKVARQFFEQYGDHPRRHRNGLGLAIPDKKQIESLRRAVRYLLAIERVENRKRQLRLSRDQLNQLKERQRTETAAAESALRGLYSSVWLPRIESGKIDIEKVEVGGRPLQSTGVHERIMELLTTTGTPKVHGTVTPRKIVDRVKLGETVTIGEQPRFGITTSEVRDAFFCFLGPPRLTSDTAIVRAIVRGVAEKAFAYTSGIPPKLGPDGKFQVDVSKIALGQQLTEDEVDLDSGFLMLTSALPQPEKVSGPGGEIEPPVGLEGGEEPPIGPKTPPEPGTLKTWVQLKFRGARDQLFKAFPAIANLADKSDDKKVTVYVEGKSQEGYDPSWLRNAVEEPLDEADVEKE